VARGDVPDFVPHHARQFRFFIRGQNHPLFT